jgi:5-methylcytosine-specific restriction endonuclease McrA
VLTESLSRKHLTVDDEYEKLLADARAALSHTLSGASEVEILKEGLRRIVRDAARRKGVTTKPRTKASSLPTVTKDIPRAVMREVWQRDEGRCQWPAQDGGICGSTHRVQFHHRQERARGGPHTVANLMLACAAHNQHAADLSFGRSLMERCRRGEVPSRPNDSS